MGWKYGLPPCSCGFVGDSQRRPGQNDNELFRGMLNIHYAQLPFKSLKLLQQTCPYMKLGVESVDGSMKQRPEIIIDILQITSMSS